MRTTISMVCLSAAFVVLIPGLILPMITVDGYLERSEIAELGRRMIASESSVSESIANMVSGFIDNLNLDGKIDVYHQTRSILGTVRSLFEYGNWFVGFLILLFSVIIPFAKGVLLLLVVLMKRRLTRERMLKFSNAISKWSMADVFVVAIFVAFLAAKATQDSDQLLALDATFGTGFYFFTFYCLLSIASAQLLRLHAQELEVTEPMAEAASAGE